MRNHLTNCHHWQRQRKHAGYWTCPMNTDEFHSEAQANVPHLTPTQWLRVQEALLPRCEGSMLDEIITTITR